jgi:hypothetical protein
VPSPSSLGVIVEGTYDVAVFARLIPRLVRLPQDRLVILHVLGVANLKREVPGQLRGLEHRLAGLPVEKAMVVRDTGLRRTEDVEESLTVLCAGREFRFPRELQFCGVRQEIETWLLADESAITRVARARGVGRRPAPPTNGALEDIVDPKGRLQRVLSECGLGYTQAICGEIASVLNFDLLRYRCPSFGRFEEKLHDC